MSRTWILTAVIAFASIAGPTAQSPGSFTSWPIRDAPAALRVVISRADLIVISMQEALVRELREGLERGGPTGALRSCHVDVVGVTQRLARGEGIAAGRTSDRLRNPTNAPRPWAAALVQANAGRRARDVEGFAVDLGDKVGVLRPIVLGPMCARCHGPADKISPALRQLLPERYPADKAIGFAEGEIRGWYWVEMPRPR